MSSNQKPVFVTCPYCGTPRVVCVTTSEDPDPNKVEISLPDGSQGYGVHIDMSGEGIDCGSLPCPNAPAKKPVRPRHHFDPGLGYMASDRSN